MLYSFMAGNEVAYVCLHAEQVLNREKTLYEEGILVDVSYLRDVDLQGETLYIDFSKVERIEEAAGREFVQTVLKFWEQGNEVRCIHLQNEPAKSLSDLFEEVGKTCPRTEEFDEDKLNEIRKLHRENLLILMEERPQGRAFDLEKLSKEEPCVFYFFYQIALRILEEKNCDLETVKGFQLVAGNERGMVLARALSSFLGMEVYESEDGNFVPEAGMKYLVVRDVVHAFYELEKFRNAALEAGAELVNAVSLLDINTGVGNKVKRISLYTIDLEKGISYRLKQKMVTFSE